jgi:hypothetical protein
MTAEASLIDMLLRASRAGVLTMHHPEVLVFRSLTSLTPSLKGLTAPTDWILRFPHIANISSLNIVCCVLSE